MRISKARTVKALALALALGLAGALALSPSLSLSAASEGIDICLRVIIPSLFPFMALAAFIVASGLAEAPSALLSGAMGPLFKVPGAGAAALLLGFCGGYPVGAKTAAALYTGGSLTKNEAERLLAFCNNCGPAFILGAAGAGVFRSPAKGLILLLSHILAALAAGLIFSLFSRAKGKSSGGGPRAFTARPRLSAAFTSSVTGAFSSVLNICAYVIFFTVLVRLMEGAGIFALLPGCAARSLFIGFFEISTGIQSLCTEADSIYSLAAASAIIGWGGVSVHCQTLSILNAAGLRPGYYFGGKLAQCILSTIFTLIFSAFLRF